MQKIKAATYVLAMLFLGLLIGGAIAGNKAAWICGLVFLILDVICGIAIQYFATNSPKEPRGIRLLPKKKACFSKSQMQN